MHRRGIALLMTLMFVIVISVSLGYALKKINNASEVAKKEKFLYQTGFIVEDVVTILQNSPEINAIIDDNSTESLATLLLQSAYIPLKLEELDVVLKISSARAKFNPAMFTKKNIPLMKDFLTRKMLNSDYGDILLDLISGIKDDNSYNSRIFDDNPSLFRDYIVSSQHLKVLNDFYAKEYNDNGLEKIDFDALFYYSQDKNINVDLNYATQEVWEMLTGADELRAKELAVNGYGSYSTLEDLDLNPQELSNLAKFKTSFLEPILYIELEIQDGKNQAKISFEYDIKTKKGGNFAYEI
jgi:hypothetical protein